MQIGGSLREPGLNTPVLNQHFPTGEQGFHVKTSSNIFTFLKCVKNKKNVKKDVSISDVSNHNKLWIEFSFALERIITHNYAKMSVLLSILIRAILHELNKVLKERKELWENGTRAPHVQPWQQNQRTHAGNRENHSLLLTKERL